MEIRKHLTYANVMVTILALLVVGGGGAYAAKKLKLKNNSVTSPKIKDGQVTNADLADGAVNAAKLQNGSVNSAKIEARSITPANVADGLLGDRSIGRTVADTTGLCSPSPTGDNCTVVTLQLPRAARVLVAADARASGGAGNASGACQLLADEVGITLGSQFGNVDAIGDFFSLNGVSGVLGPGTHTFALFCTQTAGSFQLTDRHLSAISLSAD